MFLHTRIDTYSMDDRHTKRVKRTKGGGGRCPDCNCVYVRHDDLLRHYKKANKRNPKHDCCVGLRQRDVTLEEYLHLARASRYGASNTGSSKDAGGAISSRESSASGEEEEEEEYVAESTEIQQQMVDFGDHQSFGGDQSCMGDEAEEPEIAAAATNKEEDEDEDGEEDEVRDDDDSYNEFLPSGEVDLELESNNSGDEDDSIGGDDVSSRGDTGFPGVGTHDADRGVKDAGELSAIDDPQNPLLDSELPNEHDPAWLDNIHRIVGERLDGCIVEGGDGKVKQRQFGKKSDQYYRPFKNYTELGLMVFAVKHQQTQAAMTDLCDILTYKDGERGDGEGEGRGFNVADVPPNGKGFVARLREYLPLFEIWVREVKCKPANKKRNPGGPATAKVYDIPITHVMAFLLKSKTAMEEMLENPGGAVVNRGEAVNIGLASEHVFSIPTEPTGGRRRNVMHGTLVRSMPHLNTDGFHGLAKTRLYVGDLVMCDLRQEGEDEALQVPCRIVRSAIDEDLRTLVVVVRRFRNANEVLGVDHDSPSFVAKGTLVRVWEEVGPSSEVVLRDPCRRALDLIEVFSETDVSDGAHQRPWRGEGQRRDGWSFYGEGFVERKGNKFHRKKYGNERGWRRAGSEEEKYPNMRSPEVNHNTLNLRYISLPFGLWVDDFNVWRLANPVSGTTRLPICKEGL